MEFSLVQTTNLDTERNDIIKKFSDNLNSFLKYKNYGNDLESYTIGLITVKPEFEQFFKETKPKYTKGKKDITIDGITTTIENDFGYRLKLNYEQLNNSNPNEINTILAITIFNSLSSLDKIEKKIPNFDIQKFKEDIKNYFIDNAYINE